MNPKIISRTDKIKTEVELTVAYERNDENDMMAWTAHIAEIPGAISEGQTLEEALENAMDALNELLISRRPEPEK